MQLMTFNSLLMFDIVFIFFLFLVGVTCLVYYLPPRELTPHDAPAHHHPHHQSSCFSSSSAATQDAFPSPGSGGPVVRGCASAARRISGEGGTPIILVGVRSEAEQQQQEPAQHRSPPPASRYARALTADSVDPAVPEPGAPYLPPAAYPLRSDEQEVLLLDCTLEDLIVLQQMAGEGAGAGVGGGLGIGEMRLSRAAGSEPCRNCCCQYQPSADRWSAPPAVMSPIVVPLPATPPPPPRRRTVGRPAELLPFPTMTRNDGEPEEHDEGDDEDEGELEMEEAYQRQQQQQQQHHRVEYVRIEIERRGSTVGKGSATTANPAAGGEPMSMPACCYVRAKDTDIRACSGPIHDV
uniref:Uncharacterized protein n=1 Tax=Anopheles epiroticus TaxID=199890 RepID=A0A182PLJ8_9DIPT